MSFSPTDIKKHFAIRLMHKYILSVPAIIIWLLDTQGDSVNCGGHFLRRQYFAYFKSLIKIIIYEERCKQDVKFLYDSPSD